MRALLIAVLIAVVLFLEAILLARAQWLGALVVLIAGLILSIWLLWRYLAVRQARDKDGATLRDRVRKPTCCFPMSPKTWRKPDPFLYDQNYLKQLGFEVTYDNPDISIYENGQLVPGNVDPNKTYEIVARIWNGSFQAPAFNVLVEFYIRHLGMGPVDRLIGSEVIPVIQVRGLPPSFVRTVWTTPDEEGHYCIVVRVHCVDDANPDNNQGQKNIDIGDLFPGEYRDVELPIANGEDHPLAVQLAANHYELPPSGERRSQAPITTDDARLTDVSFRPARKVSLRDALAANASASFPVSAEVELKLPADPVEIAPGQEVRVPITMRMPRSLTPQERINGYSVTILGFTGDGNLYGGVTYRLRPR